MSLVCPKCRRLVREDTIYSKKGDFFCNRCHKSFKIPKKYYLRDELTIPINPKGSSLKVRKNITSTIITIPNNLLSKPLIFSTAIILFFSLNIVADFKSDSVGMYIFFIFIASLVWIFSFIAGTIKRYLIIEKDKIIFKKKFLFFSSNHKEKIIDISRISKKSSYNEDDYIEIFFKNYNTFEFGYLLDDKEIKYILAEVKLAHFYTNII